ILLGRILLANFPAPLSFSSNNPLILRISCSNAIRLDLYSSSFLSSSVIRSSISLRRLLSFRLARHDSNSIRPAPTMNRNASLRNDAPVSIAFASDSGLILATGDFFAAMWSFDAHS
ncbi:hypothetical protein KEM55_007973, partial [Ascosphaera atra]